MSHLATAEYNFAAVINPPSPPPPRPLILHSLDMKIATRYRVDLHYIPCRYWPDILMTHQYFTEPRDTHSALIGHVQAHGTLEFVGLRELHLASSPEATEQATQYYYCYYYYYYYYCFSESNAVRQMCLYRVLERIIGKISYSFSSSSWAPHFHLVLVQVLMPWIGYNCPQIERKKFFGLFQSRSRVRECQEKW